jgi:nucleotide-binding universal stress UspA family protein
MKILLAIDGSKFSQAAVQQLIALTSPREVEVRLLHVIELWPVHIHNLERDLRQEKREEAEQLLARTAQQLRAAGFNVTTIAKEGDPKVDVIDVAAEWHADLIMVGSHGRKGLDRFFLGSVSEAVARHSSCSVQIVRVPTEVPTHLAVSSNESGKDVGNPEGRIHTPIALEPEQHKQFCKVCGKPLRNNHEVVAAVA